jgi:hypothetical protein
VPISTTFPQLPNEFCTFGGKPISTVNDLSLGTYDAMSMPGKLRLTSPVAGPTLQSQTGFGGCDTVESDSPIKRKPWFAGALETGREMLIRKNEHFLLLFA